MTRNWLLAEHAPRESQSAFWASSPAVPTSSAALRGSIRELSARFSSLVTNWGLEAIEVCFAASLALLTPLQGLPALGCRRTRYLGAEADAGYEVFGSLLSIKKNVYMGFQYILPAPPDG